MGSNASDVVIVGGGAAGCAVAYCLARAGVPSTIIERDSIAANSSGYSAGGLNPLEGAGIPGALGPLAIASFRMHLDMWPDLTERSGIDFEPRIVSSVRVGFDDSDFAEMETTRGHFESADESFSVEWLDAAQVRELEPRISEEAVGGLSTRGNAVLSSLRFTQALASSAVSLGATVMRTEATGVASDGSNITAIRTADGDVQCGAAVFATGPWAADVENWLGIRVPVEPYKGEILRMRLESGPPGSDFQGAGVSLYRREGDQTWVGATEERRGFDVKPSDTARSTLMKGALELMPEMADAELVLHTACLRPLTPDWMPIIGRAPGWSNAYLATGAGKKGILLSPGIGQAVANLIVDGETDLPVEEFGPERFTG